MLRTRLSAGPATRFGFSSIALHTAPRSGLDTCCDDSGWVFTCGLVVFVAGVALVISGTGGESPTTTDAEKETLLRAVAAVGDGGTLETA